MFFKNIDTWEQKTLRIAYILFTIAYYIFTLLIPVIIIGCRYEIFKKVSSYRLTGWGIILIVVVVFVAIRTLNKALNKLPETTLNEQRLKYSLLGVKALVIPIFIVIVMGMLKNDFTLAYKTILLCVIFFIVGILIDYLFIKYLEREIELRRKAKEKIEVDKRVENLKK